jgi:hypothetical protein
MPMPVPWALRAVWAAWELWGVMRISTGDGSAGNGEKVVPLFGQRGDQPMTRERAIHALVCRAVTKPSTGASAEC